MDRQIDNKHTNYPQSYNVSLLDRYIDNKTTICHFNVIIDG